jgi:hypothetical protein
MTDKDQQLKQFRDAVDRKADAAEEASHAHPAHGGPAPEEAGQPQGGHSPREQGGGKDKMTADKWNQ